MLGDDVVRAFNNFYNPEIPASSMINTIGNIFKVISALSGQTRELEEKFTSLPDYKKAISEISKSYNMPVVEIESLPFYERMLIFVSHNIEEHTTVDLSNIKEFVYSNGVFALGLEFLNNAYNLNERGTFAIEGLPYRSNDMNLWSRSKGFTRRSSTENIYNALALDKGCEIDLFKSGPNSDLLEAGMEQVEEAITTVDQAYTPLYRLISNAGLFLHMFENRSYKKRLNRISIGAGYVLTRNHEINEEVRSSNEFLTQLNDYVVNSSK